MTSLHKRRLCIIGFIILGVCITLTLCMLALKKNISLYYTPSELATQTILHQQSIRVGGLVQAHSIKRNAQDLSVNFQLTDLSHQLNVRYSGILPDLFREGQGVVVRGHLLNRNELLAEEVLAKHDETYMPAEVKIALAKAKESRRAAIAIPDGHQKERI